MQQPNLWTSSSSSSSAAVLANQMEQLSVKNNSSASKNSASVESSTANNSENCQFVSGGVEKGEALSATDITVVSASDSGHSDNPQGGMKFGGMENGVGTTEPGSVVTESHSDDGKHDFPTNHQPRMHIERHLMKVPPTKKDARKLFVGGIPSNVTDDDFRVFFEQFGEVVDSVVMYDRDTHRSRGFGFVTFENLATAKSVLEQARLQNNKVNIHGKDCEVKAAEPKASNHDSHYVGHHYRDKRKGHDHRSAFGKVDQNRILPNTLSMQTFQTYAASPYYASSMAAYQQQYFSNMAASNTTIAQVQGGTFPSTQTPYEEEGQTFSPQSQPSTHPVNQYAPVYYHVSAHQQYAPYGPGTFNVSYGVGDQEPITQDRVHVEPPGYPFPGQTYGYQNTFSPVPGSGTPPPAVVVSPQQVVPGFVTISPFQGPASYEITPFGSDQSTSDIQGDETR